ncbi:MAG: PIN domain-containing protein [Thermaerobacter sp.]|nr:PIN domain-containing protein [Thermaerobacter sp.]
MTERVFVDTNILLYAYDASPAASAKHATAERLLTDLWARRTGCVSIQVLQEFFSVCTRKWAHPMDTESARAVVNAYVPWPVHSPTAVDVLAAIDIHRANRVSIWDALIVRSAAALGCARIWTEDLSAGQVIGGVQIANPFADLS